MALLYIFISLGLVVFLIMILIEYFNLSSGLKPKVDAALQEIRECEMQIEDELSLVNIAKQEVDELKPEIGKIELELAETGKVLKKEKERASRRKPNQFKIEE